MALSMRTIYLLFIAAVLAACAAVIVPQEQDYANDPLEKANRGEVTALSALSLLRAANAQRALDAIRARSPAESVVQSLDLRPTSLSTEVADPADGSERSYNVDAGFGVHAGDPRDASSDYGASFRSLDMTVPERMTRAVLAQLHRPESDVNYVVASIPSSEGSQLEWLLYLQHGRIRDRIWRADANGANLRRNGT